MDPTSAAQQAAMSGNMSANAAREVSVLLSANTGPYQREMQKAAEATGGLADALVKVEEAYKGTLRFIGGSVAGIGAAMQASATGALWTAAQFEESFARVAKTTGLENELFGGTGFIADTAAAFGVGDNALQQFENDIRMLSTQIPVGVQELSYLADVAGTLGVESENLVLFADTAAKLGAGINELGSDQAIAGLANLIGAFGLAEEKVEKLGSSLAELANNTRGNASEMLQFSDRLSGTAVQVGMAADEVLGFGAAISAIGVMPELGASAMVQVINQMSRAIQGGGRDLEKFSQAMGLTRDELTAQWDESPTQVLMHFINELSRQGEGAMVTLQKLGLTGVNVTQVFGGLAAQTDVLADAMGISLEAFDEGTAVAELAEIRFNTLLKSVQRFGQATTEVFRSLGVWALPILKQMMDLLTGVVNIFNRIPQPVKSAIGAFMAIGGALAIVGGAFLIFFAQFHAFFAIIHGFPILLNMAQAALVKFGGAAAGPAVTSLEKLRDMFVRLSAFFADFGNNIRALIPMLSEKFAGALARLKNMAAGAAVSMQYFWETMVGPRIRAVGAGLMDSFAQVWPKMAEGMRSARAAMAALVTAGIGRLRASVTAVLPLLGRMGESMLVMARSAQVTIRALAVQAASFVAATLPRIGQAMMAFASTAQLAFTQTFAQIGARLTLLVSMIQEFAANATQPMMEGIRRLGQMASQAVTTMRTFWTAVIGPRISAIGTGILDQLIQVWPRLAEGLASARAAVAAFATAGLGALQNALRNVSPMMVALQAQIVAIATTARVVLRQMLVQLTAMVSQAVPRVIALMTSLGQVTTAALSAAFAGSAAAVANFATVLRNTTFQVVVPATVALRNLAVAMTAQLRAGLISLVKFLQPAIKALRTFATWLIKEEIRMMGTAIRFLGTASAFAAKSMTPLVAVMGKLSLSMLGFLAPVAGVLAAIAAIGGVIFGAIAAFNAWNSEIGLTSGRLKDLSENVGMALREIERVSFAMQNVSERGQIEIAIEAEDLIETLKTLDEQAAEDVMVHYGMQLLASGNDPEEVRNLIEEIGRLSGHEIVFQIRFEDITHGEDLERRRDLALGSFENLFDEVGEAGGLDFASVPMFEWMKSGSRKEFEQAFDEEMRAIKELADVNAAEAAAAFIRARETINQAFEEGDIGEGAMRWMLSEMEFFREEFQENIEFEITPELVAGDLDPLDAATFDFPQANIQQIIGLTTDEQFGEEIEEAIRDAVGEVENLAFGIADLDSVGRLELADRLAEISQEGQDAAEALRRTGLTYDTMLEERLAQGSLRGLGDQEMSRFVTHVFETFPQEVGFERAIADAETMLRRLTDEEKEFTEEADRARQAIERWSDEFAQIKIDDISSQLNAETAIDQVRMLQREIAALDTSTLSGSRIAEQLSQMMNQSMDQAVNEFRQAMNQYDRLIDQREESIRSHQERLERMEEDHNRRITRMREDHNRRVDRMREDRDKSIQDANENHIERLEDINEAEKKALEDRVDQQARAFSIIERISATPTAGLGSMIDNMRAQNAAMEEMTGGIQQLREMGLSEDVMEELGFNDPKNFAQVRRLLEAAMSDPSMINSINQEWARRMDLSEAFTTEVDSTEIKDRFQEQRDDAKEALEAQIEDLHERFNDQLADVNESFQRQLADANDNYARQVDDANKNHERQLEGIADNLAKLGQNALEEIDSLIERASDSGLEKMEEWAQEIIEVQGMIGDSTRAIGDVMVEEMDSWLRNLELYKDNALGFLDEFDEAVQRDRPGGAEAFETKGEKQARERNRITQRDDGAVVIHSGGAPVGGGGPGMTLRADGGVIPGTGNEDTVPAMLTPGEYVQPVDVVNHYGIEFMEALRDKKVQPYATGGIVGSFRSRGREPLGSGNQTDLVNALTRALANASLGNRETNNWDVKVEAQDTRQMLKELEAKKRLSRLTGGDRDL